MAADAVQGGGAWCLVAILWSLSTELYVSALSSKLISAAFVARRKAGQNCMIPFPCFEIDGAGDMRAIAAMN